MDRLNAVFARLLFTACYFIAFYVRGSIANSGYLVVTPSAFRPNTEQVISVTILKPSQPIYVEAKLFSKTGLLITAAGHEIFGKGTIKLKVPKETKGRCTLKICGNCVSPREDVFTFYNSTIIMVEEKGTSVFIQMDKPIYKPGQTVRINIFSTGPDLRPVNGNLSSYIVDPRGTKMTQWNDLTPLCCGLVNISYDISEQPVLGNWTVFAKLQGATYNRTFEIQKYVLPKFEVFVQPPAFIRNWSICEPVFVHARYTYGRPVKGVVSVTVTVHGADYYQDYKSLTMARVIPIEGVVNVSVCVSELVTQPVGEHFRGALHVTAEVISGGERVRASDSTCPVNRHLIELQFTKDTRRHFKPGLPFKGKLLVYFPDGSPADNVTVRLRADVSGRRGALSLEEFISTDGLVHFTIPALPLSAQTVWIDAMVLQIDSQLVSEQYMPVYRSISSWYSPSQCHVLVEPRSDKLKVGDEAKFLVYSTCSCNITMFYEVMARGNIVHSGIHFARHVQRHKRAIRFASPITQVQFEDEQRAEQVSGGVCTIYIKFVISHQMAPFSRLLIYYVRSNGEGVADSLMFTVEPAYQNKISVESSVKETLPGELVRLSVHTTQNSCVCIGAVDKSVQLLKPGYQLSTEEIFEELESFDLTVDEEEEGRLWGAQGGEIHPDGLANSRHKRSTFFWQQTASSRDALYAFEECGMQVMTDNVGLHHRQEIFSQTQPVFQGPARPGSPHQVASLAISQRDTRWQQKSRSRKRSFFPETWIWKCFNTSSTRKTTELLVLVPDTITSWVIGAVGLSRHHGLALADPIEVTTFKKFFVTFTLPYSVTRREQVKVATTLHNYLDACAQVHVRLTVPTGVNTGGVNMDEGTYKVCVMAGATHTLYPIFTFTQLGDANISVVAQAYVSPNSVCCTEDVGENEILEQDLMATDSVITKVKVEAEGIPRHYTHSVFFCPNEKIRVSTPNKYEFVYLPKPESFNSFTFSVRASNDARLALSASDHDNDDMYVVVIGGWSNSQSWVARGNQDDQHLVNVSTHNVLSEDESRKFWISWQQGHVKVGYGHEVNNDSLMLSLAINVLLDVHYIGFSTGWGSRGEFSVWRNTDVGEQGYGEVFHLGVPANIVEGSQRATVKLIGDVIGPAIQSVQSLLRLPSGCGEQNMVHFAPNVYVLQYLNQTGQLTDTANEKLLRYLTKGLQRQLTYRRRDGSYSAFGERDTSGSMWLTAFVIKCYSAARPFLYVDGGEVRRAVLWVIDRQHKDGSFPPVGRLINKRLQGGSRSRPSLTAYVVLALLEYGPKTKLERLAVASATSYLERHAALTSDPYNVALITYALVRLQSEAVFGPLRTMKDIAVRQDGLMYWKLSSDVVNDEMNSAEKLVALPGEVETASYALLALTALGDVAGALPVVKWLSQQRSALGGFISTHDTCLALQALTAYAGATYRAAAANLSVTLASTNMDLHHVFELRGAGSGGSGATGALVQQVTVPSLPTGLFVSADGDGCALLQIDVSYNIPAVIKNGAAFALHLKLSKSQQRRKRSTESVAPDDSSQPIGGEISRPLKITLEACTKWLHAGTSNMAVLEVTLLTGMLPDPVSLDRLLHQRHLKMKRYDVDGRTLIFYFDEIASGCRTCVSFEAYQEYVVGRTQPAPVRVYDYYEPAHEAIEFYNASHLPQLTDDLCDDSLCHRLRDVTAERDEEELPSRLFGSNDAAFEMVPLCIDIGDGGYLVHDNSSHRQLHHGEPPGDHQRKQHHKLMQTSVVEQSTANKSVKGTWGYLNDESAVELEREDDTAPP